MTHQIWWNIDWFPPFYCIAKWCCTQLWKAFTPKPYHALVTFAWGKLCSKSSIRYCSYSWKPKDRMHVTLDSKRVFGSFTRTVNKVISVQVETQCMWITVNALISPCVLHLFSVFGGMPASPQNQLHCIYSCM